MRAHWQAQKFSVLSSCFVPRVHIVDSGKPEHGACTLNGQLLIHVCVGGVDCAWLPLPVQRSRGQDTPWVTRIHRLTCVVYEARVTCWLQRACTDIYRKLHMYMLQGSTSA